MDLFSKNKILFWAVIILAVLNIILLVIFWSNYFQIPKMPPRPFPNQPPERFHALEFFKQELQLNDEQVKQLNNLMGIQFKRNMEIQNQIHQNRRMIFDEVFNQNPNNEKVIKLVNDIGKLQFEFENENYKHFKLLKKLCKPEQYDKLKRIIGEVMMFRRPSMGKPKMHEDKEFFDK